MSSDAFYDAVREAAYFEGYDNGYAAGKEDAQQQHWIRVKDRMPDPIHPSDPKYRPYLVMDSFGYLRVADYTYDKYFQTCYSFHVDGEEVTDVEYWMRIEPPKRNN